MVIHLICHSVLDSSHQYLYFELNVGYAAIFYLVWTSYQKQNKKIWQENTSTVDQSLFIKVPVDPDWKVFVQAKCLPYHWALQAHQRHVQINKQWPLGWWEKSKNVYKRKLTLTKCPHFPMLWGLRIKR